MLHSQGDVVNANPSPAAVSLNPATGEIIGSYPFVGESDLDAQFARVMKGYEEWKLVPVQDRVGVLEAMAGLLRDESERVAATITAEMGKPIVQARAEVLKAATVLDWYAEHGPSMLQDQPTTIGSEARVTYQPLGPVLAIEPWNFPVWQIMRGGITILLGGNAYVLKPAPTTVGCALLIEELWSRAGLPDGAFSVLNAEPDVVSAAIRHEAVAAVTLTGSVGAGSAVAAQAGREVKKVVLELGGADPFIVLADADLDAATDAAIYGRFQNSGQVCIAAKRIIVEAPIAEEFTAKFAAKVKNLVVGDPTDEATFVGPIARADLRDEIDRQVQDTVAEGGRLLAGGSTIDGPGFFYQPTVLADVKPGMTAFDQEIFGPVAGVVIAADRADAVRLANLSEFGLSASVWTRDNDAAREVAEALEVGGVFINRFSVSDPRIPIGGVKKSGFGRELSHHGVHEFMNIKAIWANED
jgi:succinate-semialdehyde dehydrogenase